ncbi:hypothetical protein ACHAQA_005006 [Verticillium albo-atrum]
MFRIYNIYVLAAFGTIGGMLFGFDVSSMSAWIGADQYLEYFNHPSSTLQGGITASMSGGSLIGALAAGFIADPLGRKGALQVASVVWIIGSILQCSAQNVAHLIVGRVVNGLAIGITSSQCCVYLAELAPAKIRGRIVGIQQWSIEWGILIMYLISYACIRTTEGPAAWRIAWGVQAIPGAILLGALFFFPESPRWLAGRERWEEAFDVLCNLHGGDTDRTDPLIIAEWEEVKEAARIAKESKDISFLGLFGPNMWRRTMAGCSVQIWQQLLGGNVMLYYLVYIFNMAGMSGDVALTSSIIQYVIFLVTTAVILPIVDRVGRRPLLLGGGFLAMIIHFSTAGVMATYGRDVDSVAGNDNLKMIIEGDPARAVIALSYIFVGIYGPRLVGSIALRCSLCDTERRVLAWQLHPTGPYILSYIIFGIFCAVLLPHVFFFFPETAGKTLEEIDIIFDENLAPWKTRNAGPTLAQRAAGIRDHKEEPSTVEKESV